MNIQNNFTSLNDSSSNFFTRLKKIITLILIYKKPIFLLIIAIIILIFSYRLSKPYRVSRALKIVKPLKNKLYINSQLSNPEIKKLKLCDFHIATAYRPYMAINQKYDYCDLSILEYIIMSGVRSIYIDVFNSSIGKDAHPIVCSGLKEGEWKLSVNTIKFEDLCKTLRRLCFNAAYVGNFSDPFILLLNLNTNNNINCLNKMKQILYETLENHLLDNRYTYCKKNILREPIENFKEKILIITSDEYKNSDLEEFVNYSWSKTEMQSLTYKDILPGKIENNEFIDFNRHNMTIITPEESWKTKNFDPNQSFELGCQFVCLNYQKNDKYLKTYLTKFKNDSFLPKELEKRGVDNYKDVSLEESLVFKNTKNNQGNNIGQQSCPEKPSENYSRNNNIVNLKDDNSKYGLCFINEKNDDCNSDSFTEINKTGKYKLCCSNNKINDVSPIKNDNDMNQHKHFISPYLDTNSTTLNLKLSEGQDNFETDDNENTTVYLSEINSNEDLLGKEVCLIDTNNSLKKCPNEWDYRGKIKSKKDNLNLCCKNT